MTRVSLLVFVMMVSVSHAQDVFTEQQLIAVVKQFHPVARQSVLANKIAEANTLASRGVFDPVASFEKGRKEFGAVDYYDNTAGELRLPTWYGIDFVAGGERLIGDRLNPEETKGTMNYVGVSVGVIQNLVIDRRRAAIKQARLFARQTEMDQRIVVNELLADATAAYWDWWRSYEYQKLATAALSTATRRHQMVVNSFQLGERAAIDTVESYAQIQLFGLRVNEASLELFKSRLELSAYLWTEGDQPFELPEQVVPSTSYVPQPIPYDSLMTQLNTHPVIAAYDFRVKQLDIQQRLNLQSLLPDVKLYYNQLGTNISSSLKSAWFDNNFRYGVSIALPLRLSEARGEYQAAKLKTQQARLSLANKALELRVKVNQYYREWVQLEVQVDKQREIADSYRRIQLGEETKLTNGESSLFLVNARELRTVEEAQKLIDIQSKLQKARNTLKATAALF
jgi:outer membrane protein TolC